MSKFFKLTVVAFLAIGLFACSSDEPKTTVNINVEDNAPSAAEGFDLEQFHRLLIEEGEKENQWDAKFLSDLVNREDINNLDLNQNGTVDTILVEPFDGGEDGRGFQLYTKVINREGMENDEEQSIATVMVAQEGDKGSLSVSGNEQVYGHHHHYHSSGLTNFMLMYWMFSPRYVMGPGFYGGYSPAYGARRPVSTSAYRSNINNRNSNYSGKQAPKATKSATSKTSAVKQKTAATGIKSKLANPTSSQRSFRSQSLAKSRAASGFGKKSTGTKSSRSSGRSGGSSRGGK